MLLTDHMALDATGAKTTREGFMVAMPNVARTGIQTYTAAEMGLTDRSPGDVIRVYRPEAAVFDTASMRSFSAVDVTIDHPSVMVDSKNWRELAVGMVGEGVARDGDFVRAPMILKDQAAVDAVKAGKAQLSVGYTCDIAFEPGKTPGGDAYDAIQSNIRANHIALCNVARGGPDLRITDSQGDNAVTLKTITFDGLQIADVSPAAEALILKLQGNIADAATAKTGLETQVATLTTTLTTKDAEIVTLKQQVADAAITPAKLRDAAKAYATTVAKAKALAPSLSITDAMDEPAIKKAVVAAKLGDAAKDWTDAQIDTSFATLAAGVKDAKAADPFREVVLDGALEPTEAETKAVTDARQAMLDEFQGKKAA
jgi:hypothetical protein